MDRQGRTPLHFALSNAGRKAAPAAVRLLLSLNKTIVNSVGGGPLPLLVLSEFGATVKADEDEQRKSCEACLKLLLSAKPNPTAAFFTALLTLPDFLVERAIVMKVVQEMLNEQIAQRYPTMILILDFYAQIIVVIAYSFAVKESVDLRFDEDNTNPVVGPEWLIPLYAGAGYFVVREAIQIMSLISTKSFHLWLAESSNWFNVIYIFIVLFWTIEMTTGDGNRKLFRTGSAISIIFIWTKFLAYLRNMLIDFAVFIGGVLHVMRRLAAFLLCLIIILVAFSRMFFTLYRDTGYCGVDNPAPDINNATEYKMMIDDLQCESYEIHAWCNGWDAFIAVYTMFLVVILLANVLIAIVTDSYKVIQDQRAAIVFWTYRLDFIAQMCIQMDAIANNVPWADTDHAYTVDASFGKDFWKRLMNLFEDSIDESVFSFEYICYTCLRLITFFFIIPSWIILGTLSAGLLWPPQVREFVFTSTVSGHNSESERENELRTTQVQLLKSEIGILKEDLLQELAIDRTQLVQMKSLVAERKLEIQTEMKHIKRIVTMLFEQQSM
jgi:hypothetical protein